MLDFSTGKALGAMRRTTPFIAFRMIIYFGIGLAYALGIGTGAGTGYLITAFSDDPGSGAGIGGLAGFGIISVALYWAREYLLYLVKAGHIAVLVKLMDAQPLPGGKGQIDYAQGIVRERFKEAFFLMLIQYGLTFVIFLLIVGPVAALATQLSENAGGWSVMIAIIFAWSFKAALLEPFAIAALMQVYFKVIEGQQPDAEWDEKLSGLSGGFRGLKDKALAWTGPLPSSGKT